MQYFLQFIWNRRVFLFFVALQVIAITLVIRSNSYHKTRVITSANRVTGQVLEGYNSVQDYINLRETNRNLAEDNARLRSALESSYFEMYTDRDTVVDTLYRQQYQYISAQVINSSVNKRNNYLTLNKGRKHGIEEDMGVISHEGAIGTVTDVSDHYCSVIPLIHGRTRLSGTFSNSDYFGTVSWQPHQSHRQARLSDIPRQARITRGDTVVTDTRSNLFPSGIIIGMVDSTFIDQQDQFYEVDLNLAVDFGKVRHVYIVVDLLKQDRTELENRITDDE